MAVDYPTILAGLKTFLVSGATLADANREAARVWLRAKLDGTIHIGRLPQKDDPNFNDSALGLILRYVGGDQWNKFTNESSCAHDRVQFDLVSQRANDGDQGREAMRILLNGFCSQKTDGAKWDAFNILTCVMDSKWLSIPNSPQDASDHWKHRLVSTWVIVHSHTIPLVDGVVTLAGD